MDTQYFNIAILDLKEKELEHFINGKNKCCDEWKLVDMLTT